MKDSPKQHLEVQLTRQTERISKIVSKLDNASTKLSYIRLGYFAASVFALYFISRNGSDIIFFSAILALLAGFIYLVSRHNKLTNYQEQLSFLKEVKQQHISRMNLVWERLPEYNFDRKLKNHPFSQDLNITGEFSIHHLMDTAIYEGGSQKLADWLLEINPGKHIIQKRQKLARELIPLTLFRDRLQVNAFMSMQQASDKDWTMEQLLNWMRSPRKVKFNGTLLTLTILSLANIILLMTAITGISGPYVIITFLAYLGIYNLNTHKITGLFDSAFQIEKQLRNFSSILLSVEEYKFKEHSGLHEFLADFKEPGASPSEYLKKISRLGGAASLQKNQVLWPLVNMVIPWDLYFSMKMEGLKAELEPKLTRWLAVFYELEALNSIATFAALNLEYTFPEITNNEVELFCAENLGHPLIPDDERVSNDFEVKKDSDLFLITGSNMAGKSTFLRTVGINLCLAFSGAPVCASFLQTNLFRLFTSINVKDSLGEGLSHFYAEVRRLRRLLDELESEQELPLYFFVDEIFKGTNNRERFQGSTAFLKKVAGKHGVGMVSTHDLELAVLEQDIPQLSNWHFSETIEDGKMRFEYKLQPGPCPTTNALKIMRMEGLPVE